jgi:hypothetical protein
MVGRNGSCSRLLPLVLLSFFSQILSGVDFPATAFRHDFDPLSIGTAAAVSPLKLMFMSAIHSALTRGRGSFLCSRAVAV